MRNLRPGDRVRVSAPGSRFYGATGHVIGRSETKSTSGWLIRFTTLGVTANLAAEELDLIASSRRPARSAEESDEPPR
jgi:hypothetical protein